MRDKRDSSTDRALDRRLPCMHRFHAEITYLHAIISR